MTNFRYLASAWLMTAFLALTVTPRAFAQETARSEKELAEITQAALDTLNGHEWNLEVTSMAAKKEDRVTTKDTVIFKDNKLNSSELGKKGFGTSNYTLTVGDDGIPVFETMQRNDAESTVFWRGEVVDGNIRGVFSVQEKDKPSASYGFRGSQAGEAAEIPAEKVEPQPEPVAESVEPAPAIEATETAAADVTEAVAAEAENTSEAAVENVADETSAPAEEPAAEPVKEEKLPWWAKKR